MPADATEPTLGAALREAREAAGMTVEQVSADTRIRATLIRDLEANRFASSMGAVYARGHIKSIAATLKVDPKPLLALFDQVQDEPAEPPLVTAEPVPASIGSSDFVLSKAASLRPERRGPRWGVALSGAAVVLVGLIAIGSLSGGGSPRQVAVAGTPTPTVEATQPSVEPTQPAFQASLPPVSGAQLRVRVIGGTSWVSIASPTATLFEGILRDGQFKDFHDATKLKVIIGNAPVVSLNCNGRDSGPVAPNNHKVGHFSCTSTGLTSS